MVSQGFKNYKSWYTIFRAPNIMFAYTIVHLNFRVPEIVVRARVYANVYLVVHLDCEILNCKIKI